MNIAIETPDVSVGLPIELTSINTIRALGMDGVQAARLRFPQNPHGDGAGARCCT